ncbi:MAG: nucleotidyl transferase AbiEii/AbiGii toxin family protein, partial [Euzebyales bacterium]|nr:nucleotidyl transferase AbiEii/AbiGii toxin family protein [Euzebyales bacterium]
MAAHGVLDRTTRDLDYFGGPDDAAAVHRLADALEHAAKRQGLEIKRDRQWQAFVRFRVSGQGDECEVDLGIDYRALDAVQTRYGPALELRELGANKVLAVFARAEPRDFVDLAELTKRFPLDELIALAAEKDPGLDLAVLDEFMDRVRLLPRADFELDDRAYQGLLVSAGGWQTRIRQMREQRLSSDRGGPKDLGIERCPVSVGNRTGPSVPVRRKPCPDGAIVHRLGRHDEGGVLPLPAARKRELASRMSTAESAASVAALVQAALNDTVCAITPNSSGPSPLPAARPATPTPAAAPGAPGLARTRDRNSRPDHPQPAAKVPMVPATRRGPAPPAPRTIATAPAASIQEMTPNCWPPSRSARIPVAIRVMIPATLPTARSR